MNPVRDLMGYVPPQSPGTWAADGLGLACVFVVVFAFTLAGLAVIP